MTAAILASVGSVALSLSGAITTTRRLRSGTHSFASALTSARVISGVNRWLNPYS